MYTIYWKLYIVEKKTLLSPFKVYEHSDEKVVFMSIRAVKYIMSVLRLISDHRVAAGTLI